MATREEVYQAIRNADAAGDSEGVRKLGAFLAAMDAPKATAGPTQQEREAVNPTNGMGTGERILAGAGKAVSDLGLGVRSLYAQVADKVAPNAPTIADLVTGRDPSRMAAIRPEIEESRRLDAPLMDTAGGMVGNIGGQIASVAIPGGALGGLGKLAAGANMARTGNALSRVGQAMVAPTSLRGSAGVGAAVGALQPALDLQERAGSAAFVGAGAAGGMAALNRLARVVRPNVAPNVQALMNEGVTPTPGQILGGAWNRAESALTSVPIVGDAIQAGRTRAVADLNTAAFNRALKPIGEALPKGMAGRDAVEYVGDTLGKRYEAILPKLNTQADDQFMADVINLRQMMGSGSIDPTKAAQFESILNNQVLAKFMPGADGAPTLTGQTMKGIESDLGALASKFRRSLDPDQQMVGDALMEVQSALRKNVQRSNPEFAGELKAINEGYANFKRVQRAAAGVGSEEGVFSPAQLQSAVKAADRSKDKAQFAEGNALMQDLSEPGKTVLGANLPDSGTARRMLTSVGAGGALAALSPATLAGTLGASAIYSRPGQNALAALLVRRPDAAAPISNALQRLAPYGALPALGASTQQR